MKKSLNKIDTFFKLSLEAYKSENEFIYSELKVSKEEYLENKMRFINKLKFQSNAAYNKSKNEFIIYNVLEKLKKIIQSSDNSLKNGIENLIIQKSPQFQFRNIEKLDETDLRELLSDINFLEEIEKIERDYESKK